MNVTCGSRSYWEARVNAAQGLETLFDRNWVLIAASQIFWTERFLTPLDHLGQSLWDLPLLRPALPALDSFGIFEGHVRGLKVSVDMANAGSARRRDLDVWPVAVENGGVLVHVAVFVRDLEPSSLKPNSFRLRDLKVLQVDRRPAAPSTG